MKKTQFIDIIKDIRKNIISIVSILVFVSLSVEIYFGMSWYIQSVNNSYDDYVDENKTYNIEYYFAYGADDEDIQNLKNEENVDIVEGTYITYGYVDNGNGSSLAEFKTYGGELNRVTLVEGTYPQNPNEVLIEKYGAQDNDIQVGDVIKVDRVDTNNYYLANKVKEGIDVEDTDLLDDEANVERYALKADELKVCGIVSSATQIAYADRPFYYETLERTSLTFFVQEEAIDTSNLLGYNKVYVYSKQLSDLDINSEEYDEKIEELVEELSPTVEEINNNGYNKIHNGYENLLKEVSTKLEDANNQISEGEQELQNGKKEYDNATIKISDAQTTLKNSKQTLDEGESALSDARDQLEDAYNQLNTAQIQYNNSKAELDTSKQNFEIVKLKMNNDLYYSFVCNSNISDIVEVIKDYIKIDAPSLITQLKDSDDVEIQNFIKLSTLSFAENDKDKNLIAFANNYINDAANIENYIRASIVSTYNENLSYLVEDESFGSLFTTEMKQGVTSFIGVSSVDANTYDNTFRGEITYINNVFDQVDTQLSVGEAQLVKIAKTLSDGWSQYDEYQSIYNEKLSEYNDGLAKYNDGIVQLEEAKKTLSNSKIKISDAQKQLEEGKQEYEDGLADYEELKDNYDSLKSASYVCNYKTNAISTAMLQTISSIFTHTKDSLVRMYFVIALLICYCVISRMVNDATKQIGTKKALGFRNSEIFAHYLVAIALILLISILSGVGFSFLIQHVIISTMDGMIQFPVNNIYFSIKEIFLLTLLYFFIFGIITYISCKTVVKKNATILLNGSDNTYGKRHFYQRLKVWDRLSLLSKTTINNCFTDYRRVISTVIGITSCVVLLISAVTLGNNVKNSFEIQFKDYYHFDSQIKYDGSSQEMEEIFNENGIKTLNLYTDDVTVTVNNVDYSGYLYVYESGKDIHEFIDIKASGNKFFNNQGIWVSAGLNELLGMNTGDSIEVETYLGDSFSGTIDGFVQEHIAKVNIYIDSNTYESISDNEYETNTLLFNRGDNSISDIEEMLSGIEGVTSIVDFEAEQNEVNNMFVMLTGAIELIYFSASVVLSIFVILNLLTTLVEEKRKEVIVLMINGYSVKKAKKYIYTDTIYLTIISIIIGTVIGNIIGTMMVKQMQEAYILFNHTYDLCANIISIFFTIILVVLMMYIALRKVDRFKLNEATQ